MLENAVKPIKKKINTLLSNQNTPKFKIGAPHTTITIKKKKANSFFYYSYYRYEQVIMDLLLPGSSDAFLVKTRLLQHMHDSFSGGVFVNSA